MVTLADLDRFVRDLALNHVRGCGVSQVAMMEALYTLWVHNELPADVALPDAVRRYLAAAEMLGVVCERCLALPPSEATHPACCEARDALAEAAEGLLRYALSRVGLQASVGSPCDLQIYTKADIRISLAIMAAGLLLLLVARFLL
jgi:hypothetical protein